MTIEKRYQARNRFIISIITSEGQKRRILLRHKLRCYFTYKQPVFLLETRNCTRSQSLARKTDWEKTELEEPRGRRFIEDLGHRLPRGILLCVCVCQNVWMCMFTFFSIFGCSHIFLYRLQNRVLAKKDYAFNTVFSVFRKGKHMGSFNGGNKLL